MQCAILCRAWKRMYCNVCARCRVTHNGNLSLQGLCWCYSDSGVMIHKHNVHMKMVNMKKVTTFPNTMSHIADHNQSRVCNFTFHRIWVIFHLKSCGLRIGLGLERILYFVGELFWLSRMSGACSFICMYTFFKSFFWVQIKTKFKFN